MTYIDLINEFWRINNAKAFPRLEGLLYLYLLQQCNLNYWNNPFEVKTKPICENLLTTHSNVYKAREKLKQKGLIDFEKGQGSRGSIYTILGVVVNNEIEQKKSSKESPKESSKESSNADFTLLYKDNKTIKTNDDVDDDKNKKRAKKVFPEIGQVIEYFKSTADGRINDWQTAAELFFHTFNADGWVNRFGRPVANWRSEADKWIIYRAQAEKRNNNNPRSYETKQRDRFSERRGTPPSISGREAFGDPL